MQEIISISLQIGIGNLVIDINSFDDYRHIILDKKISLMKFFIELTYLLERKRIKMLLTSSGWMIKKPIPDRPNLNGHYTIGSISWRPGINYTLVVINPIPMVPCVIIRKYMKCKWRRALSTVSGWSSAQKGTWFGLQVYRGINKDLLSDSRSYCISNSKTSLQRRRYLFKWETLKIIFY